MKNDQEDFLSKTGVSINQFLGLDNDLKLFLVNFYEYKILKGYESNPKVLYIDYDKAIKNPDIMYQKLHNFTKMKIDKSNFYQAFKVKSFSTRTIKKVSTKYLEDKINRKFSELKFDF